MEPIGMLNFQHLDSSCSYMPNIYETELNFNFMQRKVISECLEQSECFLGRPNRVLCVLGRGEEIERKTSSLATSKHLRNA